MNALYIGDKIDSRVRSIESRAAQRPWMKWRVFEIFLDADANSIIPWQDGSIGYIYMDAWKWIPTTHRAATLQLRFCSCVSISCMSHTLWLRKTFISFILVTVYCHSGITLPCTTECDAIEDITCVPVVWRLFFSPACLSRRERLWITSCERRYTSLT